MGEIKSINASTLKKLLDSNEVLTVDVRESFEYQNCKIDGALNLPLSSLDAKQIPQLNNQKLVIYCHSGNRSMKACNKLLNDIPDIVLYNLEGGISAWIQAGFPVKKSAKCTLSLDQQVRFIIGVLVLIGSLLGYFKDPNFLLIPVFLACGLIFSGLTGWCGLGLILAKISCNRNNDKNSCNITK